jgi:WD40 repeat protein
MQSQVHLHQSGSWSESFYPMTRISASPDGQYVISIADDNKVVIWNLHHAGEIRRFYGHQDPIGGITITPDGKYILSGSGSYCFCGAPGQDNIVRFWNAQTGELIHEMEGHTDLVTMTHMTPDGKRGISASVDSSARVWNLETGELLWAFEDIHPGVWSAAISPDGKTALTTGISDTDASLKYWDLDKGDLIQIIDYPEVADSATKIIFAPDGETAYAGTDDLSLLDLLTGNVSIFPQEKTNCCVGFDISSDQKTCYGVENSDTILRSWDIESGKIIKEFGAHGGNRTRVELSSNDQVLLSSGVFGELYLWDVDTTELIRMWNVGGVNLDIDMTDDGSLAISQGPNNSIVLHNLSLPLEVDEVRTWVEQNRVVRDLSCEERLIYSIEPLCETE